MVKHGVPMNLPLNEFCGRSCFKQAVKHSRTDRVQLLKAFCAFLLTTQMFAVQQHLFDADGMPFWNARVDVDSHEAFCMFMDAHPRCPKHQKWSRKDHKFVDKAGVHNRKRQKKRANFQEEDAPAKRAKPAIEHEFEATVKLEVYESQREARRQRARQKKRQLEAEESSSDSPSEVASESSSDSSSSGSSDQ